LADVQAVEIGGQADIGAVIHDELDACAEARSQFASVAEHLASIVGLVAILQQGAAGGGKFLGRAEQFASVGKAGSVKNRIQAWKWRHESTAETGLPCLRCDQKAASRVSTITFLFWPGISQ